MNARALVAAPLILLGAYLAGALLTHGAPLFFSI
jgi:hypothetical protein